MTTKRKRNTRGLQPGGHGKCNRQAVARRIRAVRRLPVRSPDLRPLIRHVLRLAADSAKRGYCTRSGQEIAHARRLTSK